MRIYVGNMNYSTTEDQLIAAFAAHGEVEEVAIITDHQTGQPRGIAFVVMPDDGEAQKAIEALDGQELDGRTLTVNKAKPRGSGNGYQRGSRDDAESNGSDKSGGGYNGSSSSAADTGGIAEEDAPGSYTRSGDVVRSGGYSNQGYRRRGE